MKDTANKLNSQLCEILSKGFDVKPILEKIANGKDLSDEDKKVLSDYHKKLTSIARSKRWRIYG